MTDSYRRPNPKPLAVALAMALVAVAGTLSAQTLVSDLVLEVVEGPPPNAPGSSSGYIEMRMTNRGPDPISQHPDVSAFGTASMYADRIPFRLEIGESLIFTREPSDCLQAIWTVDDLADFPTVGYAIRFGILDVGESVTCRFRYDVNPGWPHDVIVKWLVHDPRSTDPNPTNDRLTMRFRGTGARIPTLDTVGLVAFALALALAFFVVRRRMGMNPQSVP